MLTRTCIVMRKADVNPISGPILSLFTHYYSKRNRREDDGTLTGMPAEQHKKG